MKHSTDRILTTHCGSLIRTREVIEVMKARTLGEPLAEKAFEDTVAAGVGDVVRRQVDAGVDVPNDGEYSRRAWNIYIEERVDGLEAAPGASVPWAAGSGVSGAELEPGENSPQDFWDGPREEHEQFPGFSAQYNESVKFAWMPPGLDMSKMAEVLGRMPVFRLVRPLSYSDTMLQRDIGNLRAALDGLEVADAFITAVTPMTTLPQESNVLDFYPSYEAYEYALADILREEYKAIIDAGFVLQIDRPELDRAQDQSEEEIAKALDAGIEIVNYALRDIPEDRVRLHWCGGSGNRPHLHNIPIGKVAKSMLKVNVGAYGFEAASPRHEHEWEIWKDVKLPEGKIIIPGIISQSTNVIEHPELVAWRIKNFARLVGRENVIAGVDCGFSQRWEYPRTHSEIQWAKLHALAEGAAIASNELWGRESSTAQSAKASGAAS